MAANARSWFRIENKSSNEATIYIYDEIGLFGVTAAQFVDQLNALDPKPKQIALRINSPGGDVFEGVTIFNALRRFPAEITTHIDGVAASIASVIALAGDVVMIADNAFYMIHEPFALVVGTASDMRKTADTLDQVSKATIISAYIQKTEQSEEQIRNWMAEETWFTAEEALSAGFVDQVETGEEMQNAGSISRFKFKQLPGKIAARIRNSPAAASGAPSSSQSPGVTGSIPVVQLIRHKKPGARS